MNHQGNQELTIAPELSSAAFRKAEVAAGVLLIGQALGESSTPGAIAVQQAAERL